MENLGKTETRWGKTITSYLHCRWNPLCGDADMGWLVHSLVITWRRPLWRARKDLSYVATELGTQPIPVLDIQMFPGLRGRLPRRTRVTTRAPRKSSSTSLALAAKATLSVKLRVAVLGLACLTMCATPIRSYVITIVRKMRYFCSDSRAAPTRH